MDQNILIIVCLSVVGFGGLYFGVIEPIMSGDAKAEKRKKAIEGGGRRAGVRGVENVANRRKQVEDTLKEVELRRRSKKATLDQKLQRAGLKIPKTKFYLYQVISGICLGLFALITFADLMYALGGVLIGALGLPHWYLGYLQKKRVKKFIEAFPEAIDVIVRGVKAGLPLGDCLRIVSVEAPDPVNVEFRGIIEAQTMGLSIADAVDRIPANVPTQEANFFSIVINIQQKAGGNLAEALSGLSKVLRDRRKMKQKIQAMSSEAKASAGIIASLPFIVGLLVYLTSPHYIEILWLHPTGHIAMAFSAIWMVIGVAVMRKMINFDF